MTTVEAIKELMSGWNKVEEEVRRTFPYYTEREIYETTKAAVLHALKIGGGK